MEHSPSFLRLVADAKTRVREISTEQAHARLAQNPRAVLLDVHEDHEWQKGHAVEAVHLGRGIGERDLEKMVPDPDTEIITYCGGGFRSALTCDVAQKMGYHIPNIPSIPKVKPPFIRDNLSFICRWCVVTLIRLLSHKTAV